jgi:hypothetical protein
VGWFFLGLLLGYGIGWNRKVENIPKDLEKCTVERSQQEIDIAYYKKLTRTLVDENKNLRKQTNDA